ncbi:MAG TPA: YqiA/YcfP family alpha/beta fold hydrolase [Terriglobales bacterium]|nr:YqiA/YcfP family alpha/beta fold hydrolase [Terriglobales bacterium]HXZ54887.1 YqiA/YcfP family alpha/beta fold hydrolase [Burkholderiales bacterium]HYA47864.1 YqiA/YcfP family alpha/beta fold hydrolase [Burkholderiales bacterium]
MIVYLHGFNSSPRSAKAQYLQRYLEERGEGEKFACPRLPQSPKLAIVAAEAEIARRPKEEITLVGSSLGGFYATWLAERHSVRAVLINPAIEPHIDLRAYLGIQHPYHGGAPYELSEQHLSEWQELFLAKVSPEHYLLLVETGDEALDYRHAVTKYSGARRLVVQGGDHGFASFAEHVPLILAFAGMT